VTEVAVSAPRSLGGRRLALVAVVVMSCIGLLGWWAQPGRATPARSRSLGTAPHGRVALCFRASGWSRRSLRSRLPVRHLRSSSRSSRRDPTQASGLILRYAVLTDTPQGVPGAIRGWPPLRYQLAGLHGHIVQLGNELRLAVGATSRRIGSWRIDAFDVTYAVAATGTPPPSGRASPCAPHRGVRPTAVPTISSTAESPRSPLACSVSARSRPRRHAPRPPPGRTRRPARAGRPRAPGPRCRAPRGARRAAR
jgi:hypothetical protein